MLCGLELEECQHWFSGRVLGFGLRGCWFKPHSVVTIMSIFALYIALVVNTENMMTENLLTGTLSINTNKPLCPLYNASMCALGQIWS